MKKFWRYLLGLCSLFCLTLGIVACGGDDGTGGDGMACPHMEVFTDTIQEPTCVQEGREVWRCSECGQVVEEYTVPATGEHSLLIYGPGEGGAEATCTEGGYCLKVCEFCPYTEKEYFSDPEHQLETVYGQEATCYQIGWEDYEYCTVDGCGYSTYVEIPQEKHAIVEYQRVEATCCNSGNEAYEECQNPGCGYTTYTNDTFIPQKLHDLEYRDEVPATTEKEGCIAHYYCNSCKLPYRDFYGEYRRLNPEDLIIPIHVHNYIHCLEEPATCERRGMYEYYYCACGQHFDAQKQETTYENLVIPALGHDMHDFPAQEATCTQVGWNAYRACSRGDKTTKVEIPMKDHVPVVDEAVAPTLTTSGLTEGSHCDGCKKVFVAQQYISQLYPVTVSKNFDGYGVVTSEKDALSVGFETAVTATAKDGYQFFGWFDGDRLISRNNICTVTMEEGGLTLTARFTANSANFAPVWDGTLAEGFAGGTGTESDPYLISTGAQLAYLAKKYESGPLYYAHFKLTNDIDMGGIAWTKPIGINENYRKFAAMFDGCGYTIYNLNLVYSTLGHMGLFGVTENATIKNVNVEFFTTPLTNNTTSATGTMYIGGLIGAMYKGTVTDCSAVGKIDWTVTQQSKYAYIGGLIGVFGKNQSGTAYSGTINACAADVEITVRDIRPSSGGNHYTATIRVGGLIGSAYSGKVTGSIAYGDVNGYVYSDVYENYIYSIATAGGFVGETTGGEYISCVAKGNVSGYEYVGGFAGNTSATYTYCSAESDVRGIKYVGGFAGYVGGRNHTACAASGTVLRKADGSYQETQSYAGGYVGYTPNTYTGIMKNCYTTSDLDVVNVSYVGAFGGLFSGNSHENCYALGDILCEVRNVNVLQANNLFIGAFAGASNTGYTAYYNSTQTISIEDNDLSFTIQRSTFGAAMNLDGAEKTAAFYSSTLKWQSVYYNFYENYGAAIILTGAGKAVDRVQDGYIYYQATVSVAGVTTDYMVEKGGSITLTATEVTGKTFVGWYIGDECVSEDMQFVYTPNGSAEIQAKYE